MSEKMKAYRVNMITPEDAANGAKKGQVLYFHSNHPEVPGLYLFVEKPGDEDAIPLYMQQVARVPDYDREDTSASTEAEVAELPTPVVPAKEDDGLSQWEREVVAETLQQTGGVRVTAEEIRNTPIPDPTRGAGLKHDSGKPRPSLLIRGMPRALMRVAEVLTFGAAKYEAHSWRNVENGEERYDDAKLRHMFKDAMGEEVDDESNIDHLAHECCNLLFLLEKKLTAQGYTF